MNYLKRHILFYFTFILSISTVLFTCSKDNPEKEFEEVINNPEPNSNPEPVTDLNNFTVDPDKIVNIDTNSSVGEFYNFWSTRPMINQNRFNVSNFRNSLQPVKSYTKTYNLVRTMGGRTDNQNDYYKGVDASGKIITDFSGLIMAMRNFRSTGFKPRIVLSKVPWAMVENKVVNRFGNTSPPDNYDHWRQYVNAFLTALINEFGFSEVKTWRFRVSTEPNFTPSHWNGTAEEYFKHYDITVDEVLKVIPDATVGPGNMLTENEATFTTELIDHCATGTNYVTGAIGTKMDFFSISYYEKIDQNTVALPRKIEPYRNSLNSYSQFNNIPLDIQEFGILRDENAVRGLSLTDATELGASWYATVADMVFDYKIAEVYDWGQEIENSGLPQGRRNVTEMFKKMEGGNRLISVDNLSSTDYAGVIPVTKNGNIYLLVYNHNPLRNSTSKRTFFPQLEGSEITGNEEWKVNEWTVDKDHGVLMHELYKDIRAAGVSEKSDGRIYGNRPSDRFEDGWEEVMNANLAKYEDLGKFPNTITNGVINKKAGKLTLKVDLEPHSVKLIELIPQ